MRGSTSAMHLLNERIDDAYIVAFFNKRIDKVRTDKPGTAGH